MPHDPLAASLTPAGILLSHWLPQEFTLAELRAMPKQEQIATHFCIQGWSGVAKGGGVPMRHILRMPI